MKFSEPQIIAACKAFIAAASQDLVDEGEEPMTWEEIPEEGRAKIACARDKALEAAFAP